jgi:hypothetical protein
VACYAAPSPCGRTSALEACTPRVFRTFGAATLVFALLLASCGGDGGSTSGPDPSFQMSVSPGSMQVMQGEVGAVQVTVNRTGGFDSSISFSSAGLPQGASGNFAPASLGAGVSTAEFTIAAGNAPAASYTVTVTAQGGGTTRSVTLTLTILEGSGNGGGEGGVTLSAAPSQFSVQQGGTQEVTVGIQRLAPFAGPVTLALVGAPSGISGTFAPNPVGGAEATLTLSVGQGVAPGAYQLTVQGTGSPQATTTLSLTVTAPPTSGSTWNFCAPFPVWVAYQDGGDGPWLQAPGGNGLHTLDLQSDRAAVATAVPQEGGGMAVTVHYGTRAEFEQRSARCEETQATKTVHGTVSGVAVGEQAWISLGTATTVAMPGADSGFTLTGVPPGTLDLLASRVVTTFDGGVLTATPEQLLLRRGVDATDGSTLPVLDFGGAEAFVPETGTLTVTGLGAGDVLSPTQGYLLGMAGERGVATYFQDLFAGSSTQRPIYGIPAGRQVPGELHLLTVAAATGGGMSGRTVTELFSTFGNRTVALGPEVAAPAVSIPTTAPYPRPRLMHTIQPEYGRHWLAAFQQTAAPLRAWFAIVTSGFHQGGGTVTFDVEDFSGVPGWDPSWALRGGEAIQWALVVSGWDGSGGLDTAPNVDGAVTRSGYRAGVVGP